MMFCISKCYFPLFDKAINVTCLLLQVGLTGCNAKSTHALWGSMLPLSVLGSLHHSINYIMKRQLTEAIFSPSFFPLLFWLLKEITKCGVQEINRGEFSWTWGMRGELGGITDIIYTWHFPLTLVNYSLLNNQLINAILNAPSYFLVETQNQGMQFSKQIKII